MPLLSEVRFGALAVYSPRGQLHRSPLSKRLCLAVKEDRTLVLDGRRVRVIPRMVWRMTQKIGGSPLEEMFADRPVLVPAPRSSPLKSNSLYPAEIICRELLNAGFGSEGATLLERTHAVTKAATAASADRPTPHNHYDSLAVRRELRRPPSILVVDDVVTSGGMLLACVSRLKEEFPDAEIAGFALIRTMSDREIENIYEPCVGTIRLRGTRSRREP